MSGYSILFSVIRVVVMALLFTRAAEFVLKVIERRRAARRG